MRHQTSLAAGLLLIGLASPCRAADAPFRVEAEGPTRTFFLDRSATDPTIESSAVEPIGDGRLWLIAHDKDPHLVVVEAETGRRVGEPLATPAFPLGLQYGPKWEGLALDDSGIYYVIGSHSGKPAERAERSLLLQFRLTGEGTAGDPIAIDPDTVVARKIDEALIDVLRRIGLEPRAIDRRKIEGLAVRTLRDEAGSPIDRQLVIGLREPDDRVRVFAMAPARGAIAPRDVPVRLEPLFTFAPGHIDGVPLTLTALDHSEALGGFLINTATEDDDNGFHGNVLWFIPDARIPKPADRGDAIPEVEPIRLLDFEAKLKAEGLAILPGPAGGPHRLAVVYDNDAKSTGLPSRLQVLRMIPTASAP